jgi:hypothetical protein
MSTSFLRLAGSSSAHGAIRDAPNMPNFSMGLPPHFGCSEAFGLQFFFQALLASAMQDRMHGAKRAGGGGRLAMHLDALPHCPPGTPESGCHGGRRAKGRRAEPNRGDVQSDDSRQPPPPRTLSRGRKRCLAKPCDAVGESMQKTPAQPGPCERFQSPIGERWTQNQVRPGTGYAAAAAMIRQMAAVRDAVRRSTGLSLVGSGHGLGDLRFRLQYASVGFSSSSCSLCVPLRDGALRARVAWGWLVLWEGLVSGTVAGSGGELSVARGLVGFVLLLTPTENGANSAN